VKNRTLFWVLGIGAVLLFCLAACILIAIFVLWRRTGQASKPETLIGTEAPAFELPDLRGRVVRLADYRGQVVLLDFWATWCKPCLAELPHLQALQDKYGKEGLAVIAVSQDREGRAKVAPFVAEKGLSLIALLDPEAEVSRRYFVHGIPRSFLLDRQGIIRYDHTGWGTGREVVLEREVLSLLRER